VNERRRWIGDVITVVGILALFGAVYLLPPDTSLALVKQAGILRVCIPTLYPPLVTGKPEAPDSTSNSPRPSPSALMSGWFSTPTRPWAATSIRTTGTSPAPNARC
jgi:hypothetical protein